MRKLTWKNINNNQMDRFEVMRPKLCLYRFFLRLGLGRSNRKSKMVDELHNADSIVFVCKGNICRSPFAERYARELFPVKDIRSSGSRAKIGKKSPEKAIKASKKFGVDLSEHSADRIPEEELKRSDIIFVFDPENLMDVKKDHPPLADRTFILSELIDEPWIPDPYGKGEEEFRNSYEMITRSLKRMSEIMKNRD